MLEVCFSDSVKGMLSCCRGIIASEDGPTAIIMGRPKGVLQHLMLPLERWRAKNQQKS